MIKSHLPIAFALVVIVTGGCGRGSGASPAAPTASVAVPTFTAGNYTLTLSTPGTAPAAQPGSFVTTITMCLGTGSGAVGTTAVDVTVEVLDSQIVGRSANRSLLLSVQASGAAVVGRLSGSAANPVAGVGVSVQPGAGETSIGLSGTVTSPRTMGGYADGSIQFATSTGSYGCNSANWSLTPR